MKLSMAKKYKDLRDILKKIDKEYMDEVGFIFKVKGDIVTIKYSQFVKDVKYFGEYLLNHVHIIHYRVPKDVDLNHYFEVMNSRGEQLEKHEIVKAKLMNVLNDEKDKSKFATIWDACSEMNTYIQTKTGVKASFGDNLKDFKFSIC